MRMSVYRAPPAPPASSPGAAASPLPLAGAVGGVASTVVDVEEEPPPPVAPPRRGARLPLGLVLAVAGAAAFGIGLRQLLWDDEAPAPLVETPAQPSASASAR